MKWKKYNFMFSLINFFVFMNFQQINNKYTKFIGAYIIKSYSSNNYFRIKNNKFLLSEIPSVFHIRKVDYDFYYIELAIFKYKRLGINKNDKILTYEKNNYKNTKICFWKFIHIYHDFYIIQNEFNNKFIYEEKNAIKFIKMIYRHIDFNISYLNSNNKFLFKIIKVYKEENFNKKYLNIIKKEPIDILIKYIDLNDKNLNRKEFNQTYKDLDNEELRFSLRSILYFIPWIRKIYITYF